MKSKNVAFMGLALAFGLLAAFVTSKMYATQTVAETVKVVVATQNIPLGTILDEKNIPSLLAYADFPKEMVPIDALSQPEQLKGKKLSGMKAAKSWFTPLDISSAPDVVCPSGYKRFAIKTSVAAAVSGFVTPGSHVDVLGTLTSLTDSRIRRPVRVMRNALVLSVDQMERKDNSIAVNSVNTLTVAVKDEDAQMLKMFEDNGLSLVLRDDKQNASGGYSDKPDPEFDVELKNMRGYEKTEPAKVENATKYSKILVAKRTLKQNEKITAENMDELFADLEIAVANDGKLPGEAVNRSDLPNKFLTSDLLAGQWILKASVSDSLVSAAPATEIAPAQPVAKAERFTMVIWEGAQQRKVVYEKTESGWKQVDADSAVSTVEPGKTDKIEPKDAPKDAPKPVQPNLDGTPKERVTLK